MPFFLLLRDKTTLKSFAWSYFLGFIFFVSILYWLIHVTMLGWIVLSIYLALFFVIFGLIFNFSKKLKGFYFVLFISSAWVCIEFFRSIFLTGFPWALLGYSQYKNLFIIQIADIFGAYGVSFLVLLTNAAIYKALENKKSCIKYCFVVFIIIALTFSYGYFRLNQKLAGEKLRVSVIQGNIPQDEKWQYELMPYILGKHLTLARLVSKEKPDIIIWPETSIPGALEEEPLLFNNIISLAKDIKTDLLVGTISARGGSYYNSAALVSKEGKIINRYDKLHLVPFGEYIPFPRLFSFVSDIAPAQIGDFGFGKDYTVFSLDKNKNNTFSVLICFEDLFAYLSRDFVNKGAKFLVNITNDAWFKKTVEPYQHLQASVFRAVENKVWVVRAANTGVSCFINPNGKIVSSVQDKDTQEEIFISGFKTQDISLDKRTSLYSRIGDIFVLFCFILFLGVILLEKFGVIKE